MIDAASHRCLLAINNYYYPRGGAEVLFLEHNRMLENIGWQVVPFAMRHPNNLATPWSEFFPRRDRVRRELRPRRQTARAPRVIYSLQARRARARCWTPSAADRARPQYLSSSVAVGSSAVQGARHSRGDDGARSQLACPAYTMMFNGKPCERCRGGKLDNVAVNRCIKGSLALSAW